MRLREFLNTSIVESESAFKAGDKVTIKNAKKYDSMATADKMPGVVDFIWPDGRIAVTVKVGASTGQMNVDAGDLTYLQEAADPKSPEDYEELARKHAADGQRGTRSGMVYASMMAGRARRAAKILKDGGTQEAAWRHYQGTDVAEGVGDPQEVKEGEVWATDSEKLKAMPDLPIVIHKSPYEGAERGEYTEIFVGSPKTAQQFAKYIIFKGGSARLGKRGQDIYVYHKGAGPIYKRDFRMAKLEEGVGDPEEGWCVVSSDRPRIVIDGPHLDRETALKYKQSVPPAQSSGWLVLWGKEADDGSGEYVATRAVNPSEEVKEAFKLGDRVMIVKGPKDVMGKEGSIGEIRPGLYVGAPKEFTIDYDYDEKTGNSKSIRARAGQFKAVKQAARTKTDVAEGAGDPEEGWCLVMANSQVTGNIYKDMSDAIAQQKRAPVATEIKWGKRATDGEYLQTRAVNPSEEVKQSSQALQFHVVSKLDGRVLASYATRQEAEKNAHGNPVLAGDLETVGDQKFVRESQQRDSYGLRQFTVAQVEAKIKDGEWEATQDVKPGHVEIMKGARRERETISVTEAAHSNIHMVAKADSLIVLCDGGQFSFRSGGRRHARMTHGDWDHIAAAVKNRTTVTVGGVTVEPKADSWQLKDSTGTVFATLDAGEMDKLLADVDTYLDKLGE